MWVQVQCRVWYSYIQYRFGTSSMGMWKFCSFFTSRKNTFVYLIVCKTALPLYFPHTICIILPPNRIWVSRPAKPSSIPVDYEGHDSWTIPHQKYPFTPHWKFSRKKPAAPSPRSLQDMRDIFCFFSFLPVPRSEAHLTRLLLLAFRGSPLDI